MPRQPAQDPTLSDQHVRDFATLVPRQIRASEQVPSGGTAPDRSETFAELAAMEPGLRATPDAADFRDQPFLTEQPSLGWRMLRGLVRFCIVFLIGVAATLVWQSEGDNAIALAEARLRIGCRPGRSIGCRRRGSKAPSRQLRQPTRRLLRRRGRTPRFRNQPPRPRCPQPPRCLPIPPGRSRRWRVI